MRLASFAFLCSALWGSKYAAQSFREPIHCAHRIIGGHVGHGGLAGGFFQHVCGNSEPVSAV